MTRRVVVTNRARRDLRSLEPEVARRVLQALERLAATGHGDVRRMRGRGLVWRLRVGDWRVMFSYELRERTVSVLSVHHRREAYRR